MTYSIQWFVIFMCMKLLLQRTMATEKRRTRIHLVMHSSLLSAYEQIYPDVIALKELVDYKVCPECDKVFPTANYQQV